MQSKDSKDGIFQTTKLTKLVGVTAQVQSEGAKVISVYPKDASLSRTF